MHKESKWAKKILAFQQDDGSWGYFHKLSNPSKEQPMTTEQAMRRLHILGFTKEDEPISCIMHYIKSN